MGLWYGLFAALGYTGCILFFEAAGRRIGALPVSIIRMTIGTLLLSLYCVMNFGDLIPTAPQEAWFWLGVSGFIGLFLGDMCMCKSLLYIGGRISSLIMFTLSPPIAAVGGYFFLNESLTEKDIGAMILTIMGVAIVVFEKKEDSARLPLDKRWAGIGLALVGALGQGFGAVTAKMGMLEGIGPYYGAQMRSFGAMAGFIVFFTLVNKWPAVMKGLKNKPAMGQLSAGSVVGPFLGVLFFQLSISLIETGITSTIVALVPVLIIPFAIYFYKEKVSLMSCLGAIIAITGVSVLFIK